MGAVELANTPQLIVSPAREIELIEGEYVEIGVSLSASGGAGLREGCRGASSGAGISFVLIFDAANWNTPQTVILLAAEDANRDNESALFSFSAENMETVYVSLSAVDNDPRTYVVDSLEDTVAADGSLTLREALEAANTNTPVGDAPEGCEGFADVITFASELFTDGENPIPGTITLGGSQLEIFDNLEIHGPGADLLAIDADALSRVFYVGSDVAATMNGLTVTGGQAASPFAGRNGGGIYLDMYGSLTLIHSAVSGNQAMSNGGGVWRSSTAHSWLPTRPSEVTGLLWTAGESSAAPAGPQPSRARLLRTTRPSATAAGSTRASAR